MTDRTVLNMWCGPRTVSTALMYSWRQRSDTVVFDEPFYGLYLRSHDPGHPGRAEVLDAMTLGYDDIVEQIAAPGPRPVRFVKNIGHHLDVLPRSILDEFTNALLVRDPARVLASLDGRLDGEIPVGITGLPQQVAILDHELAAGRRPIVVDAGQLLADPPSTLAALCAEVGLEFNRSMLSWPVGPKPEDGVWAPHWYRSVHHSTGFAPPRDGPVDLDERHRTVLDECRPLHERLVAYRLTI